MSRHLIQPCLLSILCGSLLIGCNIGGGSGTGVLAGIEGTGTPRGGIEGTGVTVPEVSTLSSTRDDGAELDLDRADIFMDGVPVSVAELRPGMVVTVIGENMADEPAQTVRRIEFDRTLFGPVDTVTDDDHQLSMMGQPVQLDASTVFEGVTDQGPDGGELCMVSGFTRPEGGVHATLMSCDEGYEPGITAVEVEGPVSDLDLGAGQFRIGELVVLFGSADTDLSMGALVDGAWAEAIGRILEPGVLQADRIRVKPAQGQPVAQEAVIIR